MNKVNATTTKKADPSSQTLHAAVENSFSIIFIENTSPVYRLKAIKIKANFCSRRIPSPHLKQYLAGDFTRISVEERYQKRMKSRRTLSHSKGAKPREYATGQESVISRRILSGLKIYNEYLVTIVVTNWVCTHLKQSCY